MILLTKKTMVFGQAIEQIFPYVTNMENYMDWFPGVVSIESTDDLPPATKGKRYQEYLSLPEGNVSLVIEVKESKINECFYTEGDLSPVLPAMLMEFKRLGSNGTEFNLSYYARNTELTSDSNIIKGLREDLSGRIATAELNLSARYCR
ncbi:hypothetical protein R50073_47120 [Maricurvus nonylphenolicus]|uniref:SRPBCC family protein n=1 Tax=Maricurvus nonylphenolicus TaxID=1008307 RepID=UPI0036F229B7